MALLEEVLSALRAAQDRPDSLVDPGGGKAWQERLSKHLDLAVTDKTEYGFAARSYRLECRVPPHSERWLVILRIRISGAGPYTTHNFIQSLDSDRWWTSATRVARHGFEPGHAEIGARVREWYGLSGLAEVDAPTLGALIPEEIRLPVRKGQSPTVYQALFDL